MNFQGVSEENCHFFTAPSTVHPWRQKTKCDEPRVWSGLSDPSLPWEKQILNYEITSSLIAWDLSPAVVNRDWFTSQAVLDSTTWFKFTVLDLYRRDLQVPWLHVTPLFKVTQQRTSPDSGNLTFLPGKFYFNKSFSGKSPLCWGL